eukprot:PhF_6_TR43103/c0_g1_i1/m.65859/K00750/GYG1, GYG2; glycogenin
MGQVSYSWLSVCVLVLGILCYYDCNRNFSRTENNNVVAVATLICDPSYVRGGEVLMRSLRESNTSFFRVCILPDDHSLSTEEINSLTLSGCQKFESVPSVTSNFTSSLSCYYLKLHVWKWVQYKYVLFLDADTLVLQSLDHIVEQYPLNSGTQQTNDQSQQHLIGAVGTCYHAAPPTPSCQGGRGIFNSGVLLIQPNVTLFQRLVQSLPKLHPRSYDGKDQGFMNLFFQSETVRRLPKWFNFLLMQHQGPWNVTAYSQESLDKIKIVHFIGKSKPWSCPNFTTRECCDEGGVFCWPAFHKLWVAHHRRLV